MNKRYQGGWIILGAILSQKALEGERGQHFDPVLPEPEDDSPGFGTGLMLGMIAAASSGGSVDTGGVSGGFDGAGASGSW